MLHRNLTLSVISVLLLSACQTAMPERVPLAEPQGWIQNEAAQVETVDAGKLHEWWMGFNDPVLNDLVNAALEGSPDRKEAEARILEARGNWRSSRAVLFPLITGSANKGRQDLSASSTDDFYDATFDASYEIDIFGKNRNQASAASAQVTASEAGYQAVTLSLIAETARNYIQYRAFERQAVIAGKNLESQKKTLELIRRQKELGAAPQLDVERAENLVSTTRAAIPEFKRQAAAARLRLTVLTGLLPEQISPFLEKAAPIPGADTEPLLTAPAQVLSLRPDIRAATANLLSQADLADSAVADLFPTFNIGGFFGVEESALVSSTQVWSVALGAAVTLLDFGRIEGRIDAARARETQAYEGLRKTVLQAVTDVETALSDYARINEQSIYLQRAQINAQKSLTISEELYKEGEISFLDVLDAQRTANDADSSVVSARASQALALIALYKALGVY